MRFLLAALILAPSLALAQGIIKTPGPSSNVSVRSLTATTSVAVAGSSLQSVGVYSASGNYLANSGNPIYLTPGASQNVVLNSSTGTYAMSTTDNSGTPGATTIGTASGRAAVAAGASSVVVTSARTVATSIVFAVLQANDTTCTSVKSVIPAAGSFTVTLNANCTAAAKVAFAIFN